MIIKHKKTSLIFTSLWLVSFLFIIYFISQPYNLLPADSNEAVFKMVVFGANFISLLLAFCFYSKAKGYPSFLGFLLWALLFIGFIILLYLPDKTVEKSSS
ncbi:hypothetical protein Q4591_06025 [Shewanella sp. 3_MG-2023]|uniref:hypothetical protein n=1 Tax=Shewanella sp. 3_MG-2023 TaxID=3062635 RepID=UPI0026E3BB80|nr:hypothetical protein [Shewanella sp. 3_MG-2023]MDO6774906.1 hypothetical protein [Shewanella sp. 3_MG-2023]